MPGDSSTEVDRADPLSEDTRVRLSHIDPRIDHRLLREMIVDGLLNGKKISDLSRGEQKTLDFKVRLEYEHDLEKHIQRYQRRLDRQTDTEAREVILKATETAYAPFVEEDDDSEEGTVVAIVAEIDRPIVPGGLTAIHVAAAEGDLAEVKRLAERGARLDVHDLCGLTPMERASMMGQVEVVNYIRSMTSK